MKEIEESRRKAEAELAKHNALRTQRIAEAPYPVVVKHLLIEQLYDG